MNPDQIARMMQEAMRNAASGGMKNQTFHTSECLQMVFDKRRGVWIWEDDKERIPKED